MNKKSLMIGVASLFAPMIALAQISAPVTDANSLILKFDSLISVSVWVLVSLAVLFIVWNGVQFIRHSSSPEDRKTYRDAILWGIVGLFVIISIWGLVLILQNTFGTNRTANAPSQAQLQNLVPTRTNPSGN